MEASSSCTDLSSAATPGSAVSQAADCSARSSERRETERRLMQLGELARLARLPGWMLAGLALSSSTNIPPAPTGSVRLRVELPVKLEGVGV